MAKKTSEEIGPVGGRKKSSLSEMSGDKPRAMTLGVEKVKGESALINDIVNIAVEEAQPKAPAAEEPTIEDVKPKLTPAEAKRSITDRQKFGVARAKKSADSRAKYREEAVGLVQPMVSTIDDVPHVEGIDAAYNYMLEKAGKPPLDFMVYLAITFVVGVAVGTFTKII